MTVAEIKVLNVDTQCSGVFEQMQYLIEVQTIAAQ